jgi:hypothetical protein
LIRTLRSSQYFARSRRCGLSSDSCLSRKLQCHCCFPRKFPYNSKTRALKSQGWREKW